MTSIEYAEVQRSTPIRASIARSLIQLALLPLRLAWRVLPHGHPVRIYGTGRTEQVSEAMNETLACRGFRAVSWSVKSALVCAAMVGGTIVDYLDLNPLSNLFGL